MKRRVTVSLALALVTSGLMYMAACGGGEPAPEAPAAKKAGAEGDEGGGDGDDEKGKKGKGKGKAGAGAGDAAAKGPKEPLPTLLVVQAHFELAGGKPRPLPAKLVLLRNKGDKWFRDEFTDDEANVFHKAIAWRDGILTIGAEKAPKPATLKHWKRVGGEWKSKTLWAQGWEGATWNRFRDLELGDVNGDGKDEIVIATHDRGVVAVGSETDEGWTFVQMDEAPDTFVHEIEIGDVDGDGVNEFYATPSARNKASGESQPGSVYRYDFKDGSYVSSHVVDFEESHAKEILVTDINGDGVDELYVVREAHKVKDGNKTNRVDPVRIVRYDTKDGKKWTETVVATLDDDQCRFLLPGDFDGDGKLELVAAGFKSGLWLLEAKDDGTFDTVLIDKNSGGFEHAAHGADLDGDGVLELYVAADAQKEFRKYMWNAESKSFDRQVIGPIGPEENSHITWNIQDGVF